MASPEPGARLRSIQPLSEQQLIPLLRLQASAEATATMDVVVTTQITPTFTQIGHFVRINSTCISGNIHQWNNRNMESGNDQHGHNRNNNLYLYTGCRPVRNNGNNGYSHHNAGQRQHSRRSDHLCQNATAPALPATSTNGITGTWSPATISTATVGTTTYTFTPAAASAERQQQWMW